LIEITNMSEYQAPMFGFTILKYYVVCGFKSSRCHNIFNSQPKYSNYSKTLCFLQISCNTKNCVSRCLFTQSAVKTRNITISEQVQNSCYNSLFYCPCLCCLWKQKQLSMSLQTVHIFMYCNFID